MKKMNVYDESIEMYSDSDDSSSVSPPAQLPQQSRPISRRNMASRGDTIPQKKLASKDFLPQNLQQQRITNNYQSFVNEMDGEKKEELPTPSQRSKARPPSAPQPPQQARNSNNNAADEEEDEDDEYDDELNMAQIEGMLCSGRTFDNRRVGQNSRHFLHNPQLHEEDNNFTPKSMFDMEDETDPSEYLYPTEGGGFMDTTLNSIPSPYITFPQPPLHDEQAMMDYVRLKELWELQLDVKRDRIGENLRENAVTPGVHGYTMYNPEDYANLNVTPDVKEIFGYITKYVVPPLNAGNDVKLHPFIPDYYPSVGDIDAFLKVVEPGVTEDGLGIKVLDEPAPFQSDPSVLDLRLRAVAKQSSAKAVVVKKVDNVGKNSKVIENWIKDISDLHRSKPSPSVHYSKPMPDIDLLIQEWPPEVEEALKNLQMPPPDLNCDLATYVDIVCSLLDIPVYKSRVQSLHVLFTLFLTQKQFSSNFNDGLGGGDVEMLPTAQGFRMMDDEVDHLQIS